MIAGNAHAYQLVFDQGMVPTTTVLQFQTENVGVISPVIEIVNAGYQCTASGFAVKSLARLNAFNGTGYYTDGVRIWVKLRSSTDLSATQSEFGQKGLGTISVNCATMQPPPSNIIGIFGVQSNVVSGWACNTFVADPTTVHMYINGPAGIGALATSAVANLSNEFQVNDACGALGSHRLSITLADSFMASYAGQPIYIYGISNTGGPNNALTGSGTLVVPASK